MREKFVSTSVRYFVFRPLKTMHASSLGMFLSINNLCGLYSKPNVPSEHSCSEGSAKHCLGIQVKTWRYFIER